MWRHVNCVTLFFFLSHIILAQTAQFFLLSSLFVNSFFFSSCFFKMSPEDFLEQMKIVFSQWEGAESMNTSNTSNTPQNIIARPRKNYINVHDILSTFNINKDVYNNLLVRTVINGQKFYQLLLIWFPLKAEVRFVMKSLRVDLNIPYKDQDITLVGKVIEKVRYYLLFK